jgi:hypothetical protein
MIKNAFARFIYHYIAYKRITIDHGPSTMDNYHSYNT